MRDVAFELFLDRIVADRDLENDWLEMLSLLEYVGLRKIVRAVNWEHVDFQVLIHLSEEAQHAASLRALAPRRSWTDNPWIAAGYRYFSELDQRVSAELSDEMCYPAVSWVIEQRVLYVYSEYAQRTRRPNVRTTVERILAQEKRHSEHADRADLPAQFKPQALGVELALWNELLATLTDAHIAGIKVGRTFLGAEPKLS